MCLFSLRTRVVVSFRNGDARILLGSCNSWGFCLRINVLAFSFLQMASVPTDATNSANPPPPPTEKRSQIDPFFKIKFAGTLFLLISYFFLHLSSGSTAVTLNHNPVSFNSDTETYSESVACLPQWLCKRMYIATREPPHRFTLLLVL